MRKITTNLKSVWFAFCIHVGIPFYKTVEKIKRDRRSIFGFISMMIFAVLFFLSLVLLCTSVWIRNYLGNISISSIIFTLRYAGGGLTATNVWMVFVNCLLLPIVFTYCFTRYGLLVLRYRSVEYENRSGQSQTMKFKEKDWVAYEVLLIILSVLAVYTSCLFLPYVDFIKNQRSDTTIFEDYYVEPTDDNVIFPNDKRNLIYIYLESMENTYMDKASGGDFKENYIPRLTKLADENTYFSNTELHGGASVFPNGTSFTMGSLVSQTTGVPFIADVNSNGDMENVKTILPNAVTLEDILAKQGYEQVLLQGSEGTFAGVDRYWREGKSSKLIDYDELVKERVVPEDYYVNWGIEDQKIYNYAREKLLELSDDGAPFALSLFTIDTHFPNGYKCELCEDNFDEQYENVICCADKQVSDFVSWIKEQDFYENTTIVIVGDHLSMKNEFFRDEKYIRTTYNCIINAPVQASRTKNRCFTSADMFPTVLTALGAEVKGDRLGLGTDLYSDTPTLCEELGADKLCEELNKKSDYYYEHFWGNDQL